MHDDQRRRDPARLWRGLAIWPLVVGAASAFVAYIVRPDDVGPVPTAIGLVAIGAGLVAVVVGCIGVARTSESRLERRLFATASGVILVVLGLTALAVIGFAVAWCGMTFEGC